MKQDYVLGLNHYQMQTFTDLTLMANDEQLEAMQRHIAKEKEKRDSR